MKLTSVVANAMILFIIGVLTYILMCFVMFQFDKAYPLDESGWLYISFLIPAFSFGTVVSMFLKFISEVKMIHIIIVSIGLSTVASLFSVLIVYLFYKGALTWDESYAAEPGMAMKAMIFGLGGLIGGAILALVPVLIFKAPFSIKKIMVFGAVGFALGLMATILCRSNEVLGLIISNGVWFALMGLMILKNVKHLKTREQS